MMCERCLLNGILMKANREVEGRKVCRFHDPILVEPVADLRLLKRVHGSKPIPDPESYRVPQRRPRYSAAD